MDKMFLGTSPNDDPLTKKRTLNEGSKYLGGFWLSRLKLIH